MPAWPHWFPQQGGGGGFSVVQPFTPSGGDDTAALQAALTNLPAGGAIQIAGRIQVLSGNITMPQFTTIFSGVKPAFPQSGNFSAIQPAIILNPLYTIILQRGCSLDGFSILRNTLVNVSSVQTAYSELALRAGTAVQVAFQSTNPVFAGTDTYLSYLNIVGFALGVSGLNCARLRINGVKIDSLAGFWLQNSGDTLRIESCQLKSYCVAAINETMRSATITNVTNNGSGNIRLTCPSHQFINGNSVLVYNMAGAQQLNANGRWVATVIDGNTIDLPGSVYGAGGYDWVSNVATVYANFNNPGTAFKFTNTDGMNAFQCFTHGYDTGFTVNCSTFKGVSCGVEGSAGQVIDPAPLGLRIDNDGNNTPIYGLYADWSVDTVGRTLLYDPKGSALANTKAVFVNCRMGWGTPTVLQNPLDPTSTSYAMTFLSGVAKFVNTSWTGGGGITSGNLYIAHGCKGVTFDEQPSLSITEELAGNGNNVTFGMVIPIIKSYQTNTNPGSNVAAQFDLTGANFCACAYNNMGAGTLTTRTAAAMLSDFLALSVVAYQGFNWIARIINTGAGLITVAGGMGVSIAGATTIASGSWRDYLCTWTSLTTVTFQSIGTGTN